MKHRETHPNLDVPGCFGCKVSGLSIAASATPTRRGGARAATINQKDKILEKDLDAYKRLRSEGLQPKAIDGSAQVEQKAEYKWQVETGLGINRPLI
jgi:hypothetical protein